jgi:DNA-binding XRE family transcriptional regulator
VIYAKATYTKRRRSVLAEAVRGLRRHLRLSRPEFAWLCMLDPTTIYEIESGTRQDLSCNSVRSIEKSLGLAPGTLGRFSKLWKRDTGRDEPLLTRAGGEGATLEDIAKLWGVSRERIRQIEASAIRNMRRPSRARQLRGAIEHMADKQRNWLPPQGCRHKKRLPRLDEIESEWVPNFWPRVI